MKDKKYRFTSARETAEKMESGFGPTTIVLPEGRKLFRIKSDKSIKIDIIPFIAGRGNKRADKGMVHWEREYYMHRGIGANNEGVVCLARSFNKKCPVCQYVSGLQRDSKASDETIKGLLPKQRQLFNVIDVNNREEGIQIWDVAPFNFGDLLQKMISDSEEGEGWEDFAHPEKGSTLKLGIKEETMGEGNKFFKVVSIQLVPRKKKYKMSIIDKAPCLDDCVKELDYDELKEKLEEAEPGQQKFGKRKKKDSDEESDSDTESDDGIEESDSEVESDESDAGSDDSEKSSDDSESDTERNESDSDASDGSDSDAESDREESDEQKSDSDARDSDESGEDESDDFDKEVNRDKKRRRK